MSDTPVSELQRAIGDLGPARRHVARLVNGIMPTSLMALREIENSLERCVTRLEKLDATERDRAGNVTQPPP